MCLNLRLAVGMAQNRTEHQSRCQGRSVRHRPKGLCGVARHFLIAGFMFLWTAHQQFSKHNPVNILWLGKYCLRLLYLQVS